MKGFVKKYFWFILILQYFLSFVCFIGAFYISDHLNFTEDNFVNDDSINKLIFKSLVGSLVLLILPIYLRFFQLENKD